MSEGSAVANIWTIWSCDHGPLKGRAVLLQCREDDAAMAEALAAAIGHPVTKLDWDIARTADGSSWNAGEGLDTEAQAKAAAIEQGYALIDERPAAPGYEADHHLVNHLRALYDAANRRTPPWVGEVEASNPDVHARVMALGLWFSLSHTQGNLTEAGAALLRAHPRVSDAPAVLTDPARGDVYPDPVVIGTPEREALIESIATAGSKTVRGLLCPTCGAEVVAGVQAGRGGLRCLTGKVST